MKIRNIADKRNFETIATQAEKQLQRGRITLSEYWEIASDIKPLFDGETVETIRETVSAFFKLYGIHTESHGIGWRLVYF